DDPNTTAEPRRFNYARLLGIYHVNVIYLGPGMLDHRQRRFDFLWVRWYQRVDRRSTEARIWSSRRPEIVSLVPLAHPLACSFIDPYDVVRGAHIIPRFSSGKCYASEDQFDKVFSKFVNEREEWNEYIINPFVDRDMLMRFHWGMAIGH
ncbi:hypothetical protein FA13DRAFT_1607640, partial [Coprinellus micaceus]